jgi:phosphohistidine phosphatase
MKLYFVRHGIAEEGNGIQDFDRKLTKEGIEQMRIAAKGMAALKVAPLHIYSSPRIRARQTADILADALGLKVEVREEVNFDFNPQAVETLTADLDDNQDVMFVGHEPSFSETVGALIGGGKVVMKKGGLARLDVYLRKPLRGALVWMIAPRVFETLTTLSK